MPGLPAPCLPGVGSEQGETLNSFLAMRFLTLRVCLRSDLGTGGKDELSCRRDSLSEEAILETGDHPILSVRLPLVLE